MLDNIYTTEIFKLSAHISHIGSLTDFDAYSKKHTQLCGSYIEIYIKVKEDKILHYAQNLKACIIGQATAALLAKSVEGAHFYEIRQLSNQIHSMLENGTTLTNSKFEHFNCLCPVKDLKSRHQVIFMVFDALLDCLDQIKTADTKCP